MLIRNVLRSVFVAIAVWVPLNRASQAVEVPVDFLLDASQSPLNVGVSALGASDSGSTSVSGNVLANLTLDMSGGDPLITGLEFSGGTIAAAAPLNLSLTVVVVFPLTVNITAQNIAGFVDTPDPPAAITAVTADNLSYEFDAAFHEVTLNQGELIVTGVVEEMFDLSESPVTGAAPSGTLGFINLTPGGVVDGQSQFAAELRLPIDFSDVVPIETPLGEIPVSIAISGAAVARGSFSVDLAPSESADFDKNGVVDGADFLIWQANFLTLSGGTSNTGDANGDGAVNGNDFLIWQRDFAHGGAGGGAVAAVPEPTAAVAALCTLLAMAVRRKPQRGPLA